MARNILVVEDDNNISNLIKMYLDKEGFDVRIAADGGKAVEEFKEKEPDLVLRTILSLRSPSFTVECKDNAFTFHVTGYGHGVGMSQYGANILAKQGLSAEEIVQHYFSNTTVGYYDG